MNSKNTPNPSQSPLMLKIRKDRDYDCVYVKGKKIMLGKSGSPEAQEKFRRLQIQVLSDPTFSFLGSRQVTVKHLSLAYLDYAEEHDPSHFSSIKTAVKILLKHFADEPVDSLDSRSFLFLQERFVDHGVSRQYCNSLMCHIRAMLKWGILRKLVSHQVYVEAKFIPALKKGKTKARENTPIQDVSDEVVNRSLPHFLPTGDVARKYGVSDGLISQYRKRYRSSWNEYIADKKEAVENVAA